MTICTQEIFNRDTAHHAITILRDDGLYRHITVAKPNSTDMHFEIVTWPGYLAYVGDMGAYTFKRMPDMFEFFRKSQINPGYWSEKVEAMDTHSPVNKFSLTEFKELAARDIQDFLDNQSLSDKEKEYLLAETSSFIERLSDNEYEALANVREFECEIEPEAGSDDDLVTFKFGFQNEYEGCTEFTFHFLWCCYAIVHAIGLHDVKKSQEAA